MHVKWVRLMYFAQVLSGKISIQEYPLVAMAKKIKQTPLTLSPNC